VGGAGLPGLGATDPRVEVDVSQPPWRAVGRVQTELGGRCTGFLVAPAVVLTAAHCLFLPRVGHFIQPHSVHFVVGYAFGVFAGHARVVAYRVADGADWAALRLDAPLGAGGRVLPLLPRPLEPGAAVALGGYDRDRAEVMTADLACHVIAQVGTSLRHDCAGTSGTSGAPLLYRDPAGTWWVAGLQVAAVVGQVGGMALGAGTLKF